jgi:anti-sigma regulatory factor (Ser/Thr protein kinase)
VAALGFTLIAVLRFAYFYLDDLTRQHPGTFGTRLLEETTGAWTAGLLFIGVVWLYRHFPIDRRRWKEQVPVYLAGFVAYTGLHTLLMWSIRTVLSPLLGLGPYDYGVFPTRFFMEAGEDAIGFTVFLIVLTLHAAHLARRAGERREQELEDNFVQAQLQSLRLQLQPHFLFNALNTISEAMYDDPAAADEMIGHLADLLRQAIRSTHTQEVALAEELALLEHYIAIMRARFGEDLMIAVAASEAARGALVPSLLLQPLVENAVRHGNAARIGRGHIEVSAQIQGDQLVLEVADDGEGNGFDPLEEKRKAGIGLGATAERLDLLYGSDQSFRAGPVAGRGFVVIIRIPFRIASTALESPGAPPAHRSPLTAH